LVTLQYHLDDTLAKRAGATGNQDRFLVEHRYISCEEESGEIECKIRANNNQLMARSVNLSTGYLVTACSLFTQP
jgi:hypothetical protein